MVQREHVGQKMREKERERERAADAWESLAPAGWCSTLHR